MDNNGTTTAVEEQAAKDGMHTLVNERVLNFVRKLIREEKAYKGPERRAHLRYPIAMSVRATPLDDNKKPVAGPFYAVTRDICIAGSFMALTHDISAGGISLYYTQKVEQKYLRLELTGPKGEQLTVNLELLRCRKTGPFYELGGRFTSDE
jgi:hypothetical protein